MSQEYADYRAEQEAYAEQQGQYEEDQQSQYYKYSEYLDGLLKDGLFNIYALHYVKDLLSTSKFEGSGLSVQDFLSEELNKLMTTNQGNTKLSDDEFPF